MTGETEGNRGDRGDREDRGERKRKDKEREGGRAGCRKRIVKNALKVACWVLGPGSRVFPSPGSWNLGYVSLCLFSGVNGRLVGMCVWGEGRGVLCRIRETRKQGNKGIGLRIDEGFGGKKEIKDTLW